MNDKIKLDWVENLPKNCPPEDVLNPDNQVFFRLTDDFPPSESDFYTVRKLDPDRIVRVSDCQALSLSLYDSVDGCKLARSTFRKLADKLIVQITLPSEGGRVKKTDGLSEGHYSWWLLKTFDPDNICELVDETGA